MAMLQQPIDPRPLPAHPPLRHTVVPTSHRPQCSSSPPQPHAHRPPVLNPTPTTPEHHATSRTLDSSHDTMEVGTMYQLGSAQTAPLLAATGAMATGYYAVGAWTLLVAGLAAVTTGRVLAHRWAGRS